jgi:uncharacterized protein YoaH (UPF0181 family)
MAVLFLFFSGSVFAKLPPITPEQQQAAAEKKAASDARAAKEKKQLADAMDRIAKQWRAKASTEGWKTQPPTSVEAIPGFAASETQSGPSGQPGGRQSKVEAEAPIRSEKAGTAPPSPDVKAAPRSDAR